MILTRDNILRYIKEKKAVTPLMIAQDFETTTMIASAALSELSKDNLIKITYLKLSTSPYYYDPKQASVLVEIGNNHLKGYDKEVFLKLKEQEVINASSLSIQEALAIERIKDFAKPLEINFQGRKLKFWVWFQRNLNETKKQIQEVLNSQIKTKSPNSNNIKKEYLSEKAKSNKNIPSNLSSNKKESSKLKSNSDFEDIIISDKNKNLSDFPKEDHLKFKSKVEISKNKIELFIENFFKENYLIMESKEKLNRGISYDVRLKIGLIEVIFDCFYFSKKLNEIEVIKFYLSSIRPKIIFAENIPKKLFKLSENLDNLTLVNI